MNKNNRIEFLNQNRTSSFSKLLFSFIDRSGLTDSEVYNKVYIDRRLFSKIRCNESYLPSKNNIIKLCLSLSLDKDEALLLLNSAGYTLSTSSDSDLIILYCLENNIYNINTVNDYLYESFGTAL